MTFVLLGKTGDIISFLPVLFHAASQGDKPRLMVARAYASVLEGVSYVEPIIFEGGELELDRAMTEARALDKDAVCVQLRAPVGEVRKWAAKPQQRDSFVKEAWNLAGAGPLWNAEPYTVFDKRDAEREAALLAQFPQPKGKKKTRVLLHLDGNTSPFPYAKLLRMLLTLNFPKWEIIDLGKVRAERIYDLLALYESADLGIFCDSAPLHLARACPGLPVVALIQDKPNWWHGSAWRPQYRRFIRYGDFVARVVDLIGWLKAFPAIIQGDFPGALRVWSEADVLDSRNVDRAHFCWRVQGFTDCPIEIGAAGRDSGTVFKDGTRFPFLIDALRLACMKARTEDVLCLSRAWTKAEPDLRERIKAHPLCYARNGARPLSRARYGDDYDLFCFPKIWWLEHQREVPDLVMGMDPHWANVLADLLKKHGAVELDGATKEEKP